MVAFFSYVGMYVYKFLFKFKFRFEFFGKELKYLLTVGSQFPIICFNLQASYIEYVLGVAGLGNVVIQKIF